MKVIIPGSDKMYKRKMNQGKGIKRGARKESILKTIVSYGGNRAEGTGLEAGVH